MFGVLSRHIPEIRGRMTGMFFEGPREVEFAAEAAPVGDLLDFQIAGQKETRSEIHAAFEQEMPGE